MRTIEVIHTGHDFDSTEHRPAFGIAPNIFVCIMMKIEYIFPYPTISLCASLLVLHCVSDLV